MFRIGIIGCGKIAQVRHLPEYAANPDVQIAALTDLNEERTRELASRYGAKAYASAVELLADPSIDAKDNARAVALTARLPVARAELDAAETRWLELSEEIEAVC